MSFTPRPLYRDFVGMLALALFSLTIGMGVNCIRRTPIPIAYETPAERLDSSVASIGQHTVTFAGWNKDVELPEMRQISLDRSAVILDARPRPFYKQSHIPSALSLPRDEFKSHYDASVETLIRDRDKGFVVYCSSIGCQDSQMVADALRKLGYPHVRVFRGGWEEWSEANLPKEK
jgi:rhodanese-related sulfurtransferase